MCAVDKPPRPRGVKAYDIDRFDLPVDVSDIIIYGSDFVGTQEEHDKHVLLQLDEFRDYLIWKANNVGLEIKQVIIVEPKKD